MIQPALLFQVLGQCSKNLIQHTFLVPPLEASVTRLVRWVAFRQVAPWSAGTQNPQEAVEDIPRISPRSTTTVGPANGIGDQRFEHFPLCVSQVHVPPRLEQLNTQPFGFPIRTSWCGVLEKATGRWCRGRVA